MNIPFSFGGYGIPNKYLCNKPQRIAHEFERKTCKTCEMLDEKRCPYCKTEFGQYRIKPKHKACRNYKPKSK